MTNFTLTILFFLSLFSSSSPAFDGDLNASQATVLTESDLVITEIMYDPNSSESSWEWIEIYNKGNQPIDLAGYVLDDNNSSKQSGANIMEGTILPGGVAILFDADVTVEEFTAVWGDLNAIPVTGWPGLNNPGDSIGIWASFEAYDGDNVSQLNVVEQVIYDDTDSWVDSNNASSIFLTDLTKDTTLGSSWGLSEIGIADAFQSNELNGNTGGDIGSPGSVPLTTDDTPPTIECPETVETDHDEGLCAAVIALPFPNTSEDGNGELIFDAVRSDGLDLEAPFPVGETMVTWTVTNASDNTSLPCEQLVRVIDAEVPTAIAQNITVEIDENGEALIAPEDLDNPETPSFDNCGITEYRASRTEFSCADLGAPVLVEFSVLDTNGNTSTVTDVEIMVVDKLKPSLFCGIDIVTLSANGSPITLEDVVGPTVSDNCDTTPVISYSRSDGGELNAPFDVGNTTITWQVVDASGNMEECVQTIIVDFLPSVANGILAFSIPDQLGETVIDETAKTIELLMPFGTDVTTLEPSFELSENATSLPVSGELVDFTEAVTYIVTAQDGESVQEWTVRVSIAEGTIPLTFEVNGNTEDFITELEVGDVYVAGEISNIQSNNETISAIFGQELVDTSLPDATFTVTYEVTDGRNTATILETVLINESEPEALLIKGFTLVDANSNEDLFLLVEGMEINSDELPTMNLDIRANTSEDVQSVSLSLNGEQTTSRTENVVPFALYGDAPTGDYFGNEFALGDYTVGATAFSESQLSGNSGEELSLNFTIYSACERATAATTITTEASSCLNATGSAVLSTTNQFEVITGDLVFEKTMEEGNVSYTFEGLSPGSYQVELASVNGTCENILLEFEIDQEEDCPQVTATADLLEATFLQGSSNPNPNGPILRAEEGKRETYLKFDLSSFGGSISEAVLQMQIASDPGFGTLEVFLGSGSDWTESGLNGANKPSVVGSALASLTGTHSLGQTKIWNLDVTSLTSGGELTLIVKHSNGNDVAFASDETAQAPQLIVTAGSIVPVDKDGDGFFSDLDCDDDNPNVNPDAAEICDGIDNNCDGLVDDEDESVSCEITETLADLIDATYLQGASNPEPTGPILRAEEGNRVTYLKFHMGSLPGTITQAQLKMQVASDPGNGTLEVFLGSDSDWTETGLNGSNKPTEVGSALATITGIHSLGQTKIWDLDVSMLPTSGLITLIVKHSDGNDVAFASDETDRAPELVITSEGQRGLAAKRHNILTISPNPSFDQVELFFKTGIQVIDIRVFDVIGRLVQEVPAEDLKPDEAYRIDVRDLESGIYFIRATDDKGLIYQKQMAVKH